MSRRRLDQWWRDNRLSSVTDPLGHAWAFTYDPARNLTRSTAPGGAEVTRSYTARNQLENVALSGGPTYGLTYTPQGWLAGATDSAGHSWSAAYNPLGWLASSTDGNDPAAAFTLTYAHDDAGRVTALRASGEASRAYTYDARGDLTQLALPSDPATVHTTFTYDAAAEVTGEVLPDGSRTALSYDGAGRLASVATTTGAGSALSFAYTRDANGNVVAENTARYRYDALSRLTAWYDPSCDTTTTYGYDADYNLTTVTVGASVTTTFSYDSAERITSPGYAFDAAGDMTADGTHAYRYDALSRLTAVLDASTNATVAAYTYDFENRRTSATDASGTTYFHYDGASPNVIAETNGAGTTIASYAYDASGRIHSMTRGGATYYYLVNGHGDVVALTNAAGAVVDSYRYDPWGKVLAATEAVPNPYRYAGYRWDGRVGLYYLWNRWYSPMARRFLTSDEVAGSLREPSTANRYAYCLSNPLNRTDQLGLSAYSPPVIGPTDPSLQYSQDWHRGTSFSLLNLSGNDLQNGTMYWYVPRDPYAGLRSCPGDHTARQTMLGYFVPDEELYGIGYSVSKTWGPYEPIGWQAFDGPGHVDPGLSGSAGTVPGYDSSGDFSGGLPPSVYGGLNYYWCP